MRRISCITKSPPKSYSKICTHDSGEGVDAERDLRDVPALEEVGRLEDLLVRDAVLANRRLEPGQRSPRGLGGHCRATTPSPNAGDPSE